MDRFDSRGDSSALVSVLEAVDFTLVFLDAMGDGFGGDSPMGATGE